MRKELEVGLIEAERPDLVEMAASEPRRSLPDSASSDPSWWVRRIQATARALNIKRWETLVWLFLGHGPEIGATVRDTTADVYAYEDPPLSEVLQALSDLSVWAWKDGSGWKLADYPPGKTRIGIVLPRATAIQVRHAAIDAGLNLSEFFLDCVTPRLAAARGVPK